jgi:hypothetical protein
MMYEGNNVTKFTLNKPNVGLYFIDIIATIYIIIKL